MDSIFYRPSGSCIENELAGGKPESRGIYYESVLTINGYYGLEPLRSGVIYYEAIGN